MDATLAWCQNFGRLLSDLITWPLLQSPRDQWALVMRVLQVVVTSAIAQDCRKVTRPAFC